MYYGDYGNYESRAFERKQNYEFYKTGKDKPAESQSAQSAQSAPNTPILSFNHSNPPKSADAVAAYARAALNMGQQRVTASALPLNDATQAMVGRYVTPEQEQRVSENFLQYFG